MRRRVRVRIRITVRVRDRMDGYPSLFCLLTFLLFLGVGKWCLKVTVRVRVRIRVWVVARAKGRACTHSSSLLLL